MTTDKEKQERVWATISKELKDEITEVANSLHLPPSTLIRLSIEGGWPAVKQRFGGDGQ